MSPLIPIKPTFFLLVLFLFIPFITFGQVAKPVPLMTYQHGYDAGDGNSILDDYAFSSDGEYVLTTGDGGVYVWMTDSGEFVKKFPKTDGYTAASLSSNNAMLAVGYWGGSIPLFDFESSEKRQELCCHYGIYPGGPDINRVGRIVFSNNGEWLLSTGNDLRTKLWNLTTFDMVVDYDADSISFSTQGDRYNVGRVIYSLPNRDVIHRLNIGSDITASVFSYENAYFWTAGSELVMWDLKTGKRVREYKTGSDRINFMSISPDESRLVTSDTVYIKIWRTDQSDFESAISSTDSMLYGKVLFHPKENKVLIRDSVQTVHLFSLDDLLALPSAVVEYPVHEGGKP